MQVKYFVLAFALLSACSPAPRLSLRYDARIPFGFDVDWISGSDVVVAGTLTHLTRIGEQTFGQPGKTFGLYKVEFTPEHVLKGKLAGRSAFFVFLDERGQRGFAPGFDVEPHGRSIFFLREDGEILRSFGDVLDFRLGLAGDTVTQLTSIKSEYGTDHSSTVRGSVEDHEAAFKIAQLLLAPPGTSKVDRYIQHLRVSVVRAEIATSARYTLGLLRKALTAPDTRVAAAVCEAIVCDYPTQSDCLNTTPNISSEARAKAESRILSREAAILEALERNPMQGLIATDSRQRILDQLEIVRMSTNQRIRKLACQAIDRYYPEKGVERCPKEEM
jgi:hypothetical protein